MASRRPRAGASEVRRARPPAALDDRAAARRARRGEGRGGGGGAGRGRQRGGGRGSELGARVLVAVPAAIVAVLLVTQGGAVFALGLLVLGGMCLHELYEMLGKLRPARLAGFLGLLGLLLAALYGGPSQVLLVTIALVPLSFLLVLGQPDRRHGTLAVAATLLGVVWIALALAHAVLLREQPHGGTIIIDLLIGTFLGDTGAYFGGKAFGRRPLSSSLSPNKTVEGLVIGMVVAVLAVCLAGAYSDWLTGFQAFLLGVGVAIAAPLGDLFESMVKRDAGVKDSGRAFGAHGGALDRLDAVIFAVPVGYYIWMALH